MSEPLRVLQCVNIMDRAGLETMLMNYYRKIDCRKVQFDFMVHRQDEGAYDEEIKEMGGRIFHAPRLMPNQFIRHHYSVKSIISSEQYPIVHSHIDSMSFFPLLAAKQAHTPVRIAHSHSSGVTKDVKKPIKELARFGVRKVANHYWACGNKAGLYLFGEKRWNSPKSKIIRNAIDTKKFEYNEVARKQVRSELNIPPDAIVVGHVGRFELVKNQAYLVQMFAEFQKKVRGAVLMLVGDGAQRERVEREASRLCGENNVIFTGTRPDIDRLMQAMDLFVMPSLFEGLPMTAVEAQASGLPVLLSDRISQEAAILSNVRFSSIEESPARWVDKMLQMLQTVPKRKLAAHDVQLAGFDISDNAMMLQETYVTLASKLV